MSRIHRKTKEKPLETCPVCKKGFFTRLRTIYQFPYILVDFVCDNCGSKICEHYRGVSYTLIKNGRLGK